jgi:hypothetical protein
MWKVEFAGGVQPGWVNDENDGDQDQAEEPAASQQAGQEDDAPKTESVGRVGVMPPASDDELADIT